MGTSAAASSFLPLFIDTDLDTHFTFAIDGHQSIAQLKGRIASEHANCFTRFGEISVVAVKAKVGEFFYHLSDSMILNCFFEGVEGAKRFLVDIVCVTSTSKSSDQVKVSAGACMHNGQPENLEQLNCISSDGAANMKKKVQFDTSLKYSGYFKPGRVKKNEVSSNGNTTSVDDSLPKINGTPLENPPEEILLKETISICNNKCSNSYIHEAPVQLGANTEDLGDLKLKRQRKRKVSRNEELPGNPVGEAPVQLDTDTSTKDLSYLKHKRKRKKEVSRNEELSGNPLVEDSLHKVSDTQEDNQSVVKEATGIPNYSGNGPGIAASMKESSQLSTVQHVESSLLANVDDKHYNSNGNGTGNRNNPEKVNSGSDTNHDYTVDLDSTKTLRVEHGNSSMSKVDDALLEIDVDAHMEKKLPETDKVVNRNRIHGAPVQLDINTALNDPTDLKLKRKKKKSRNKELSANPLVENSLHKINDTRGDNQPKESTVKEQISNGNDIGNEYGVSASIKESSQPSLVRHVDDEVDAQCQRLPYSSARGLPRSVSRPGTILTAFLALKHDPPSQIPKDVLVLGLASSSRKATGEANEKRRRRSVFNCPVGNNKDTS